MATKCKQTDEGDIFCKEMMDAVEVNTEKRWEELWSRWFICRFDKLREQFEIEGGFWNAETEGLCVYAHHDEMTDAELGGAGDVTPRASLEDLIASYFELEDADVAEKEIRAAVERGIQKGKANAGE